MWFYFDVLVLIFIIMFIVYGYFSGGHTQTKLFVTYVFPFVVLYFLGGYISGFIYKLAFLQNLNENILQTNFDTANNTVTVLIAYILAYIGVAMFSSFLFRYISREQFKEQMIVKYRTKERWSGILVSFINIWMLIYFMILPAYSFGITDRDQPLTWFFMEYPPPFSKLGRAASNAAPVKETIDTYNSFMELFAGADISELFNKINDIEDSIFEYELNFLDTTFDNLDSKSQKLIADSYVEFYNESFNTNSNGILLLFPKTETEITDHNPITPGIDFQHADYGCKSDVKDLYECLVDIEGPDSPNLEALNKVYSFSVENYGLMNWYLTDPTMQGIDMDNIDTMSQSEINDVVQSYRDNSEAIIDNTTNPDLKDSLTKFSTGIAVYDGFYNWYGCTDTNVGGYDKDVHDDTYFESNDCAVTGPPVSDYDFANRATTVSNFLLTGNNVSGLMLQFKYDYDDGAFDSIMNLDPELRESLDQFYSFTVDYALYYRDLVDSLDPSLPAFIRIGIAVARIKVDVSGTVESSLILSAIVNDLATFCPIEETSTIDSSVKVCTNTTFSYYAGDIFMNLFVMYDISNKEFYKVGHYNDKNVDLLLDKIRYLKSKLLLTNETIIRMGDQIAFAKTSDGISLLEKYFGDGSDGQLTISGMQELAKADDLFSKEFIREVKEFTY